VPGPIATERDDFRLDWDGREIVRVPLDESVRSVDATGLFPDGAGLPAVLSDLLGLWARERGLTVRDLAFSIQGPVALTLEPGGRGAPVGFEAGRDRWTLRGTAAAGGLAVEAGEERWLSARAPDGVEVVLVAHSPGRVRSAWRTLEPPRGDPAAFAVSWSRLFEAATLPVAGVVPLAERSAAGPAVEGGRFGDPPLEPAGDLPPPPRYEVWLAGAAALLALLSATLEPRSARV
jgi:hypothetical protein